MTDHLIFVDIETTGLNIRKDAILEIAAYPVDGNLEPLDDGLNVVLHHRHDGMIDMEPVVLAMHTENGLLAELPHGMYATQAESLLIKYVERFAPAGAIPMCGSTIGFDRKFLERDLSRFEKWFHYRSIDVSTVKELFKRWFPGFGEPPKVKAHRALPDCKESVAELAWYRKRIAMSATYLNELVRADV